MIDLALNSDIMINTELDEALQELDILFSTTPTELIGDYTFGTNFYTFLWESTLSPNELKRYIMDKISESCYYFGKFNYDVEISAYYTDNYDSAYSVQITVTNPQSLLNNKGTRIYKIR